MVLHTCNPGTHEIEAGGLLLVSGQPRLHSKTLSQYVSQLYWSWEVLGYAGGARLIEGETLVQSLWRSSPMMGWTFW